MSEQPSSLHDPAGQTQPSTKDRSAHRFGVLGLAAVCLGVAALAGTAFVLSYSSIRAVALSSGVSPRHAGDYPILIDAMVVIALLAVIGLRGAGLPSRALSWLALLAVLAVGAAADVQDATGRVLLQYNDAATTAAVLPWALVFIAFLLLLALLRHGRTRHQVSAERRAMVADAAPAIADQPTAPPRPPSLPVRTPQAWDSAAIVPGFSARLASSAAAGAAAAAAEQAGQAADPDGEGPGDEGPGDDGPGQDGTVLEVAGPNDRDPANGAEPPAAADADAPPADPPETPAAEPETEPADGDATPADPPATPAAEMAEAHPANDHPASADPPAADPCADAMAADTGSVETFPAQDDGDDEERGAAAAADLGADDEVADNMPVFHRMWSTPTPPDS